MQSHVKQIVILFKIWHGDFNVHPFNMCNFATWYKYVIFKHNFSHKLIIYYELYKKSK
jgi:hypothetical protein